MVSRESPDTPVSLRPSSVRNEMPVEFMGPRVSRARGWKMCELGRDEYFNDFLAAACSATPHGLAEIVTYDLASVLVNYGDVPCHCFASKPGYQRAVVWAFTVLSDQT